MFALTEREILTKVKRPSISLFQCSTISLLYFITVSEALSHAFALSSSVYASVMNSLVRAFVKDQQAHQMTVMMDTYFNQIFSIREPYLFLFSILSLILCLQERPTSVYILSCEIDYILQSYHYPHYPARSMEHQNAT